MLRHANLSAPESAEQLEHAASQSALSAAAAGDDFAEHQRTYRLFVKGVMIFAAHVFVILALMALFLL